MNVNDCFSHELGGDTLNEYIYSNVKKKTKGDYFPVKSSEDLIGKSENEGAIQKKEYSVTVRCTLPEMDETSLENLSPEVAASYRDNYMYLPLAAASFSILGVNVNDTLHTFSEIFVDGKSVYKKGENSELVLQDIVLSAQAYCSRVDEIGEHTIKYVLRSNMIEYRQFALVFSEYSSLIDFKIDISDDITYIEDYAFYYDNAIVELNFGKGIEYLNVESAFNQCGRMEWAQSYFLDENNIQDGILYIGKVAAGCMDSGIELCTIREGTTCISQDCFQDCENLKRVIIPESVICLGPGTWFNALDQSLFTIDDNFAVYVNNALVAVNTTVDRSEYTIKNGTVRISSYAFDGCTSLTSITIPDSVTSIGEYAFRNCTSLTSIVIPNSVTSIGGSAFRGCTNLANIILSNNILCIKEGLFEGCSSLISINISSRVDNIDNSAFIDCSNLEEITVGSDNEIYDSRDNCNAIILTSNNYLLLGCKNTIIPNTVTVIGIEAFRKCNTLENINIPGTVRTISDRAFLECEGLTTVVISDGITGIGSRAFEGCINLTSITVESVNPPTLWNSSFLGSPNAFDNTNNCPIYVPAGSVDAYKADETWTKYVDRIQAII